MKRPLATERQGEKAGERHDTETSHLHKRDDYSLPKLSKRRRDVQHRETVDTQGRRGSEESLEKSHLVIMATGQKEKPGPDHDEDNETTGEEHRRA